MTFYRFSEHVANVGILIGVLGVVVFNFLQQKSMNEFYEASKRWRESLKEREQMLNAYEQKLKDKEALLEDLEQRLKNQ